MNLKEAFRYQNFLEKMFATATRSIEDPDHSLKVTEHHLRSKANPDAVDVVKEVEREEFFPNDYVIRMIMDLIAEKQYVSDAIGKAKCGLGWDLDAAIATNKLRQGFATSLGYMLHYGQATKKTETGTDYKFNNDGDQTPYYYDKEIVCEEAYDRSEAKKLMKSYKAEADMVSSKIDNAMVNLEVDFTPGFNINDTFDDIMEIYEEEFSR